jgi:hypothetical protein
MLFHVSCTAGFQMFTLGLGILIVFITYTCYYQVNGNITQSYLSPKLLHGSGSRPQGMLLLIALQLLRRSAASYELSEVLWERLTSAAESDIHQEN